MSDFIIGGWTQNTADMPPEGFSYTMYGMITNLEGLTAGTASSPGWSPDSTTAPNVQYGNSLWTYGGGFCSPDSMPKTPKEIEAIVQCTNDKDWAGVDFDDECNMDIDNIILAMQQLKPLGSSYTFLAGWDYNNPGSSPSGQSINDAVLKISNANSADRFILMCYGSAMWDKSDIEANVSQAIDRTINVNGVPANQVILALTPDGLNAWNLNYFLDQVINNNIGGLFIWDFPALSDTDLAIIKDRLKIT